MTRLTLAAIALIAACSATAADPIEIPTFMALPKPAPHASIQYGPADVQGIDIFRPDGDGPHPVAILIHGGCWSVRTAGREQVRPIAADLARRGIAVWSIGYRRANEAGGGFPGTFEDVAAAIDRIRAEAASYRLDLSRTVLAGHSAGGHLALWAASRDQLADGHKLRGARPFVPPAVISLAGIGDLKAFARMVPILCGPDVLERLVPANATDPYADVSPLQLPPPTGRIVMVSGVIDRLVPPYAAHDYARAMRTKRAAPVELVDIADAGHFDLVTPGTPAWIEISQRIAAALGALRTAP
jgi:acetyl esterase/lipase